VRRASLVSGIASITVGVWTLFFTTSSSAVCTPGSGAPGGLGLGAGCLSPFLLEYTAFSLILGGFLLATLSLVLVRRGRVSARDIADRELRLLGTPREDPMLRHLLARRSASFAGSNTSRQESEIERLPLVDASADPSRTRRAS